MSDLDGFNKAIKHLDITPVSKDTTTAPHKRDQITKVRHIKKIAVENLITQTGLWEDYEYAGRLIAVLVFNNPNAVRITNWKRLLTTITANNSTYTQWALDLQTNVDVGLQGFPPSLFVTVSTYNNGQQLRYKLGSIKQTIATPEVQNLDNRKLHISDCASIVKNLVNAPYYTGEKLYPGFIIELWAGQLPLTASGYPPYWIERLRLEFSRLTNPVSIADGNSEYTYTTLVRSDFSKPFPGTFPLTFNQRL